MFREERDPERRRDLAQAPSLMAQDERRNGEPDVLRALHGGLEPGLREYQGELLASVSARDVAAAHLASEQRPHRTEHEIPRFVAERIVDPLEVIQVEEDHGNRRSVAVGADQLALQKL